ncbi:MAG TPA: hypothetical protein VM600_02665 [Actinomycetota bacterium]|nr:hypothetical protein [Actinomycetota bacterium]
MKRSGVLLTVAVMLCAVGASRPAAALGDSLACGETTTINVNGEKTLRMWRSYDKGAWLNVSVGESLGGRCPLNAINDVFITVGDPSGLFTDTASQTVVFDLSGGPFGPGKTRERTGTSEIEFNMHLGANEDRITVIGSNRADVIRVGASGISFNGDGDRDVNAGGFEVVSIEGRGGNDRIGANGGIGTGKAFSGAATLDGGSGNDIIYGGAGVDGLYGGSGDDVVYARDGKRDHVYGQSGYDKARLDGSDRRYSIERRI